MLKLSEREKHIVRYFFRYVLNFKKQFLAISILVLISTCFNLYLPLADKALLDDGLMKKDFWTIVLYLLIIFGVKLANDSVNIFQNLLTTYVTNRFIYNVSKDTFSKMIRFPLNFFEKFNLGELISRLNGDIGKIAILADSDIIDMVKDACILVGIVFLMVKLNLSMFLLSFLAVPTIVVMNLYIAKKQKRTTRTIRTQYDQKVKQIQEVILGIHEVKGFNIFKWAERNLTKVQGHIFREELRITKLVSVIFFISNRFHTLVHSGVYFYGAYLLVQNQLTIGELFAFLTFFNRSIHILERLVSFNRMFQSSLVSMERIYEIIEEENDYRPLLEKSTSTYIADRQFWKIAFLDVTFAYPNSNPILNQVNFQIKSGEKVALVGANGSGKSTILKLLTRLIQAEQGEIFIDGINVMSLSRGQLSRRIAYVTQQPFIFHCSIKENLLLGNRKATKDELAEIIHRVGLHEYVAELPNGLDTPLTLSGTNLSGGQLQRLAIARALLKKSEILLLDEPTSNIEEAFAERFIMNLLTNHSNQTVLMTVHKESLLKHFDRVLYVEPSGVYDLENNLTTKHSIGGQ